MKKLYFAFLLLLCTFFLTGCTTDYDRNDIIDYVRKAYGLQKFSISQTPQEIEDDEGYTDYVWTIQLPGKDGLVFHVKDDYGWGMEAVSNYLWDDYEDVVLAHLYEEYHAVSALTLFKEEQDLMTSAHLTGTFQNREELKTLFDALDAFMEHMKAHDYHGIWVSVDFQMQNPLRNRCEYVVDDGDCSTIFQTVEPEDYENALREYLLTCLDYRFEDQLAEFTEEEIRAALSDYEQRIAISENGSEEGPFVFYELLAGNKYYYGISFGTLYEILKLEGFEVTGDSWHYSFIGTDGAAYEISYDFCDYPFDDDEGGIRNGYYYLKNGEQIPMSAYFYNHFSENEIQNMTGLVLEVTSEELLGS